MRWDRFFEELEDQLGSEWEAERAALESESERLRISRLGIRDRWVTLVADGADVSVELVDGTTLTGTAAGVGSDWIATAAGSQIAVCPLTAVRALGIAPADLLRSARPGIRANALADRMTLGFVLRDAARRRIPVTAHLVGGRALTGTIDRAGSDHFDLAVHDAGAPRRVREVTGFRLVPFAAVSWIRWDSTRPLP